MRIIWSPTSRRKIDEIIDHISADNVDAALALVEDIENQVQRLKKHPKSGRMVPALSDELVRKIIVRTNYIVVYELKNDHILILTIRHSRQDDNEFDYKPK